MSGENRPVVATLGAATPGGDRGIIGSRGAEMTADATADTRQYVTFNIADEEYGVDIMAVREIKAWTGTTRLPNVPQHMRGVINLRGVVVPIFDMRARFGLGETDATKTHVVIIVQVGSRIIGILVDAVSDIMTIAAGEIREVPQMDRTVDARFLDGLVDYHGRMVALLAFDRLFNLDALGQADAKAVGSLPGGSLPGGALAGGALPGGVSAADG